MVWYISAELEHAVGRRIILYNFEGADRGVLPNMGDVLEMCREPCQELLARLRETNADAEDIEYVENEARMLKEFEDRWRTEHKKWWKL